MFLNVQLPDAASLQRTTEVTQKVEELLAAHQGRRATSPRSTASACSPAPRPPTPPSTSSRSSRGTSAATPSLSYARDPGHRSTGRCGPRSRRPWPSPSRRPPSPASASAGGFSFWLQDRSGGTVEFLSDNLQKFLEAARKRPELAGVNSPFRASVPQIFADVDREKVLKQGVAVGRRLPDAPGLPRRRLREPVQPLRPAVAGLPAGRGRGPRRARRHRPLLRAQQRRRDGAALDPRDARGASSGPSTRSASTSSARRRSPGSPRPATAPARRWPRSRRSRRRSCPARWATTGPTCRTRRRRPRARAGTVFALSLVFVFLILAALYESWSLPFSVLLSVPVAVFGAFLGLLLRGLRPRRLRPDRPRHADRPRGQERDPDRRVREGRARARARASSTPRSKARACACGRS